MLTWLLMTQFQNAPMSVVSRSAKRPPASFISCAALALPELCLRSRRHRPPRPAPPPGRWCASASPLRPARPSGAGTRPSLLGARIRKTCAPPCGGARFRDDVDGENLTSPSKASVPLLLPDLLREHGPRAQIVDRHLQLVVVEALQGQRLLALLVAQPLVEVALARHFALARVSRRRGGLDHDVGRDALALNRPPVGRVVARHRQLEAARLATAAVEIDHRLHRSFAERLRAEHHGAPVIL